MRPTRRDAVAILLAALICGLASALPPMRFVHGWSIDILTALRWEMFGRRHVSAAAPAVVIAIDEETHNTPPFDNSPTATWTPEIGRVLTAVLDGGAKVVGFDIVFANSIEQSEIPFGGDILGAKLRGFDRPFLRSLAAGAAARKVVLGEVLRPEGSFSPSAGQSIAVGRQQNIRPLNVDPDPDNVIRRVLLTFSGKERPIPSMALELASRSLATEPVFGEDGNVTLAGYQIPQAVKNTLTVNFDGGGGDILTYSLADLRACVERDNKEFFRRQFSDKVVIFGSLLDVEDRKITSKRFATGRERSGAPRCALPTPTSTVRFARRTIAGVYIHATAVNNLIGRDTLREIGRAPVTIIAIAFALLAAFAARRLAPLAAAAVWLAMALLWTAVATTVFAKSLVLPLSEPFAASIAAIALIIAWRLVVTDRGQRLLRSSFALYLAPQVIDQMLTSNKLPALGGETRNVTIFFSDLAGFSAISEQMCAFLMK